MWPQRKVKREAGLAPFPAARCGTKVVRNVRCGNKYLSRPLETSLAQPWPAPQIPKQAADRPWIIKEATPVTGSYLRFGLAVVVNLLLALVAVHAVLAAVDLSTTVQALQAIAP